jgi:hypothetical protein
MVPSDEDSAPPPSAGDRDVVMSSTSDPSPAERAPEPSPAAGVPEHLSAAGAPEAAGAMTVEEVMDLATRRYVDFPGIGSSTSTPVSSRATTGRCWRWRRGGCSPRCWRWRRTETHHVEAVKFTGFQSHHRTTATDLYRPGAAERRPRDAFVHRFALTSRRTSIT